MNFYSFDIFDTCLFRTSGNPESVFYKVGEKLFINKRENERRYWIEEFVSLRICAEKISRSKHLFGEPTIYQIWEELVTIDNKYSLTDVNFELEVEKEVLKPNIRILELIKGLQSNDHRVIFISDTYFSASFLFEILSKFEICVNINDIICSCEFSKSKSKGDIFPQVAKSENINYSAWVHYGDNKHSDYHNAKKLGINVHLVRDSFLNTQEKRILNNLTVIDKNLDIIQIIRSFRLNYGLKSQSPPAKFVINTLGPMLLSFAHWVLKTATDQGIDKLYFCSRDCRLLYDVCNVLKANYPLVSEVKYLHTSRYASNLASVSSISREGFFWLFRSFEVSRLSEILNKMGLNYDLIRDEVLKRGLCWKSDYILVTENDINQFWEIIQTDNIKSLIQNIINQRRFTVIQYFQDIGLGQENSAIVDIGWHRTVLESINSILLSINKCPVKGFYLGLNTDRRPPKTNNEFSFAMFYRSNRALDGSTNLIFQQKETLLEHLLGMCDHGTVIGYEFGKKRNIEIITQDIDEADLFRFKVVSKVLFDFTKFSLTEKSNLLDLGIDYYSKIFNLYFHDFINNPEKDILNFLSGIKISIKQDNANSSRLLTPISIDEAIRFKLGMQKSLNYSDIYWLKGRLVISTSFVRFLLFLNIGSLKKKIFSFFVFR